MKNLHMPADHLTEAQAKKQSQKLKEFHENGRKGLAPTSAGSIKPPKSLSNIKAKLSELLPDCNNVIKQAVIGGLVPEREVWKGKPEDLQATLAADPSASLEDFELSNGKVVKVIVRYVPPDNKRIATAEWTIKQEIDLKKAMVEAKNRSLDLAIKKKKAVDDGVIAEENPRDKAKQLASEGKHIQPAPVRDFQYNPEWDDEVSLEDEQE
jgi:hypothetical protein